MSAQHGLDDFRQHDCTWLTTATPLLEAGEFEQGLATSRFVRCRETAWTPLQRRAFSHRVQPSDLGIAHTHFPHDYAEQDLNVILPHAPRPGAVQIDDAAENGAVAYERWSR